MNASYVNKSDRAEIHYAPQPTKEELTEDARKLAELLARNRQQGVQELNPSLLPGNHTYTIVDGQGYYEYTPPKLEGSSAPLNSNAGILASATTREGLPATVLNDTCMVDIGGMRTTVENAVRLGYLVKRGEGVYEETGAMGLKKSEPVASATPPVSRAFEQASQLRSSQTSEENEFSDFDGYEDFDKPEAEREQSSESLSDVLLDSETEAKVESVYRTLGNQTAENLVNRYLGAQSTGNEGALEQLATEYSAQLGMDPDSLKGEMGTIVDKFTEQGVRYMNRKHGIDGRDAIEWARENLAPESIMRLAQMQFFKGDLRGYDELAQAYKWAKKGKLS